MQCGIGQEKVYVKGIRDLGLLVGGDNGEQRGNVVKCALYLFLNCMFKCLR